MQTFYFPTSGQAYDACQCNEQIVDGDLLICADGTIGIADTWPLALSYKSGHFHQMCDGHHMAHYFCDRAPGTFTSDYWQNLANVFQFADEESFAPWARDILIPRRNSYKSHAEYRHDCDDCRLMGIWAPSRALRTSKWIDVYFCPNHNGALVLRDGSDGPDYRSLNIDTVKRFAAIGELGQDFRDALTLARIQGYIPFI